MPQLLFGGLLALILLGFYIWSIMVAVSLAATGCTQNCPQLSNNMAYILNTIGGLISAVVIGVLGATQTGEFPAQKSIYDSKTLTGTVQTVAVIMPSLFILVWIICGVVTVIYGFVLYDNVPPLNASAKVWLGSAIGSVYAYFGIKSN